jgi:uncharacterized iron-regulated membrane protein
MSFRKALFWLHLSAGVIAGAIILLLSVTGLLLTYEKQIVKWADSRDLGLLDNSEYLPLEQLLRDSGKGATAVTVYRSPNDPIFLQLAGGSRALVDPYSGAMLGEGNQSVRNFFRTIVELHRWLGAAGDSRATGRAITGACNLAFFVLVITGAYLWLPKAFSWRHLRPIVWFRGGASGKARDFNWHNVIGIWCFMPLLVIVASGAVISYKWASDLVYRAAGEAPPPPAKPSGEPKPLDPYSAGRAFATAAASTPQWTAITLRSGDEESRVIATVDRGYPGQPQLRTTLTLDATTGEILQAQPFSDLTAGRKARFWLRFLHTGEALGIVGQTIAGVASFGASFLVWTGIALSLRRFRAWRGRQTALDLETDSLRERQVL